LKVLIVELADRGDVLELRYDASDVMVLRVYLQDVIAEPLFDFIAVAATLHT
jgi:hypothetical protein